MTTDEAIEFFVQHPDQLTDEQMVFFLRKLGEAIKALKVAESKFAEGEKELKVRADMITDLSEQNLRLCETIAKLTGKAPPKTHQA